MTEDARIQCGLPTGSDDELRQPTVVINMPELKTLLRRRQISIFLSFGAAVLAFAILGSLIVHELLHPRAPARAEETAATTIAVPAEITLTVKVVPENAAVTLDGSTLPGNPPSTTLAISDTFHSIQIKADGYETLSRDVKLTASQSIKIKLRRVDVGVSDTESTAATDSEITITEEDEIIFEQEMVDSGATPPSPRRAKPSSAVASSKNERTTPIHKPTPAVVTDDWGNPINAPTPTAAHKPAVPTTSQQRTTPGSSTPPAAAITPAVVEENPYEDGAGGIIAIRVPSGTTSPISVFIDKKKQGNAPVSIKVSKGLHEVVFIIDGQRTFRMINVRPGETKIVVPEVQ